MNHSEPPIRPVCSAASLLLALLLGAAAVSLYHGAPAVLQGLEQVLIGKMFAFYGPVIPGIIAMIGLVRAERPIWIPVVAMLTACGTLALAFMLH